jgi:hypothetical protein
MSETKKGHCACGAVSYEARGPYRAVRFCHCETCRRQTGLYVSATNVPAENLSVSGAENLSEWQATPDAVRRFCRICGSLLFWQSVDGKTVSIMTGSFDMPTGLCPDRHIFVSEKGDYYDIADGLPQSQTR